MPSAIWCPATTYSREKVDNVIPHGVIDGQLIIRPYHTAGHKIIGVALSNLRPTIWVAGVINERSNSFFVRKGISCYLDCMDIVAWYKPKRSTHEHHIAGKKLSQREDS